MNRKGFAFANRSALAGFACFERCVDPRLPALPRRFEAVDYVLIKAQRDRHLGIGFRRPAYPANEASNGR